MPRKYLFYLLLLALLCGLGYYGYTKWTEAREKVNLWTLVPEDAVFVLESGNHSQFIKDLKRTQVWESLSEVTYLRRLEENLAQMDSIGGGHGDLYKFLNSKTILTSVHVVSKSDFDLVFYLPISTVKEHRFVRTLGENLGKNKAYAQSTHEYQNYVITDVKQVNTNELLSYFTYRNNLIISQSPVLLEEIIRKINRKQTEPLSADFKNINYLTQEKVYANVFINYHNLPPFLNLFLKPELQPEIEYLCGLCRNGMLEFKVDNNKLFLNGFSNPQTLSRSFYHQVAGQQPQQLDMQEYLPNRLALLLHFGLGNFNQLRTYKSKNNPVGVEDPVLADSLLHTFRGELALGYLQTFNPTVLPEKVLFVQTQEPARTSAILNALVTKSNLAAKTKPYREKYGRYSIRMLPIPELPEFLFGKLFHGFEQVYFVELPGHVLFTDDAATLRSLLSDIENENVWGKKVMQKDFLEETQHQANFSVFLNSANAWEILNRYVQENKKESLLRNENLIKDFSQFALQFSAVEKQFYTSIILRQPNAAGLENERSDTFAVEQAVVFKSKIIAGPFAVRNPVNRSQEILVQDSSLALHCVSASGTISWTDSLREKIRGKVVQATFGSDGKTKYLFATTNRIHCLGRNGREIENFPYYLPDTLRAQGLTVLDWDQNGELRLLVDDEQGNLFLFDEAGDLLPGWNPRALEGRLAAPPQLYRVGEKNVLLAVLENGFVYALNESGNTYPGFPFSVRGSMRSGTFGKAGINLRRSEFTVVTDKGEIINFNLAGEILKRHQLIRPDRFATFELVPESSGKSYLIARQSAGRISLFNPENRLLLERRFYTSSKKIIQYFLFGGDKIVYAITETGPQKTYLFDGKAQPIGKQTIENQHPIQLFYNDVTHEFRLYKFFGRELKKITLQR